MEIFCLTIDNRLRAGIGFQSREGNFLQARILNVRISNVRMITKDQNAGPPIGDNASVIPTVNPGVTVAISGAIRDK